MKNIKVLLFTALLVFALISIFGSLQYINYNRVKLNNNLLKQANKGLYQSEKVLSILKDIETGTRGYFITGDSGFLEPYNLSKNIINSSIAELKKLSSEQIQRRKSIDTLMLLATSNLAIAKKIQESRHAGGVDHITTKTLLVNSKKIMDSIRANVAGIQNEENRQLAIGQETNNISSKKARNATLLFIGSIIFLLTTAFFCAQYFSRLRKTQAHALAHFKSNLIFFSKRIDDIIKGISDPFFALNSKFNFMFLNEAAKDHIALGTDHLMGKNFFIKLPRYEDTMLGKKLVEVMQTRRPETFESFDNFLDEWQDITIYPTTEGVSVSIKDISHKKSVERELDKMKELMEETNLVALVGGWEINIKRGTVTWTSVTRLIFETAEDYVPDLKSGMLFYKEGESRDAIIKMVDEAIDSGREWDAELQIITAKGNERWIRTKGKAEFEGNECVRLIGIFQDIDSQKKLAEAASRNEELFKSAFQHSPHGMALINPDLTIKEVNAALCDITGYSKEEMLSTSLSTITYPDDLKIDKQIYEEMLSDPDTTWQYEKRYVHKNGHAIWILACGSAIKDGSGKIVNFVAQMQDITQGKSTYQKLNEERKLLKTIIDNLPMNVYMKDLQSRKTLVNKTELKYMGADVEGEILGKTDFDLYPPEYASISVKEDNQVFASGHPLLNVKTKSVKKDGTETFFLTSKIPYVSDSGEVVGLIGISYALNKKVADKVYEVHTQ